MGGYMEGQSQSKHWPKEGGVIWGGGGMVPPTHPQGQNKKQNASTPDNKLNALVGRDLPSGEIWIQQFDAAVVPCADGQRMQNSILGECK